MLVAQPQVKVLMSNPNPNPDLNPNPHSNPNPSPNLSSYSYTSGDESEDRRTASLVRRLLDTHILESCSSVFEAFDETL